MQNRFRAHRCPCLVSLISVEHPEDVYVNFDKVLLRNWPWWWCTLGTAGVLSCSHGLHDRSQENQTKAIPFAVFADPHRKQWDKVVFAFPPKIPFSKRCNTRPPRIIFPIHYISFRYPKESSTSTCDSENEFSNQVEYILVPRERKPFCLDGVLKSVTIYAESRTQ